MNLPKWASCCMLFFSAMVAAQNVSVEGKVLTETNEGIDLASVLLLRASDSTLVTGVSTDEKGAFRFSGLIAGNYFLKVSFVGYKEMQVPFAATTDMVLDPIILSISTEDLEEISVTGKRPTLEKKADRLVFNVESTSISNNNTFDILKRTPGVIVVADEIMVKNTSATVYINDRRVYLTRGELKTLLEGFSGSNIKSVEVITNPSARYDAEGGTIINIVTSKEISIGYKGSINGNFTEAVYPKYRIGTDHYYKTGVVDLFASYNFSTAKDYKRSDDYVQFFNGNNPDDFWDTDFKKVTRSDVHNLNTILDFTLSQKSNLSVAATLFYAPGKTFNNDVKTSIYDNSETLESYFNTTSRLENDNTNLTFNADYGLKLGEKGAHLRLASNYIYYDDDQLQNLSTDYFNADDSFNSNTSFDTHASQKNNIYTGQADLTLPFEKASLETGIKYSGIYSKSSIDYMGPSVPAQVIDDAFKYDENIYAGYVSYSDSFDKWSLNLGVRGEYTDVTANSIALGDIRTQKYFELFPTVSFQFDPSEKHSYGIAYKRAIARPRYQSLNPYRYFLNENYFNEGNPRLGPSIENKVTLSYTYNQQFIFELYYQHINNDLEPLTFQNNDNFVIVSTEYNIDKDVQYSLDFIYYGYIKKWWYVSTYMSGYYLENGFTAVESGNVQESNSTWGYFGQLFNQLTLSKNGTLTSDISLQYLSDFIYGSYDLKNQFSANIGFNKSLWKRRAILTLNFNDIFNTNNVPMTSRYLNQDNGYFAKPESRSVSLGFRYKFGNYTLKDNNRDTKPGELDRLNGQKDF